MTINFVYEGSEANYCKAISIKIEISKVFLQLDMQE